MSRKKAKFESLYKYSEKIYTKKSTDLAIKDSKSEGFELLRMYGLAMILSQKYPVLYKAGHPIRWRHANVQGRELWNTHTNDVLKN